MKLQPISDVHLDLFADNGSSYVKGLNPNSEDITLVIAGDMCEHHLINSLIKQFCDRYTSVVYALGNHEFWHSSFEAVEDELGRLSQTISNLYWLNNSVIELEGVRFLGGTLWFEHTALSPIYNVGWSDFAQINNRESEFYIKNNGTRWFLKQNLQEGDIVVTHHLPSYQSCSIAFLADPTNIFYANQMEPLIEEHKPSLWLHGHTHTSTDYYIGDTRVICNPRGYPGNLNPSFNEQLILTVGE